MKTKIRPLHALVAVAVVVTVVSAASAQAPMKIGVFDPQRVSEETGTGKRAQANLEALRDAKQKQIADQEREINDLQQQLSQQALSLSIDKRATMEMDIRRKLLELTNNKDLAGRELQLEIAAEEAKFNEKLMRVVQQFGRDNGFSILLDRGAIAWSAETVDVTTAIIDMFDRVFPESSD